MPIQKSYFSVSFRILMKGGGGQKYVNSNFFFGGGGEGGHTIGVRSAL